MNTVRRYELLILSLLTLAFALACVAFFVSYADGSVSPAEEIGIAIAAMTYLGTVELTWYITEKKS